MGRQARVISTRPVPAPVLVLVLFLSALWDVFFFLFFLLATYFANVPGGSSDALGSWAERTGEEGREAGWMDGSIGLSSRLLGCVCLDCLGDYLTLPSCLQSRYLPR